MNIYKESMVKISSQNQHWISMKILQRCNNITKQSYYINTLILSGIMTTSKDEENFQFCIDSVLQNKMACDVFIHLMETLCTSVDQRKVLIQILINKLKNCKDHETELIRQIENINFTSKKVETSYASTQTTLENETIEATTQTENDDSNIKSATIQKNHASTQTAFENVETNEVTTQTINENSIINPPIKKFLDEDDQAMFSPESSDVEHPDPLKENDVKIEHPEIVFINEILGVDNSPQDIPIPKHNGLNESPSFSNEEQRFRCENCDELFQSEFNLNRHLTLEHLDNSPLTLNLPLPEKAPEKNDLSSSIIDKDFKCNECGKKLNNEYYLKRHLKARHPDNFHKYFPMKLKKEILDSKSMLSKNKNFKCDKCNKTMANKSNLERHFRVIHPNLEMTSKPVIRKKTYSKTKKKLQKLKCNKCTRIFFSKFNSRHCINCSKSISDPTKKKYFRCPNCSSSYSKHEKLMEHVRLCETEVQCEFCKRVFRTASIRQHREKCDPTFRKSKEDRTCIICGYVFLSRSRLRDHNLKFKGACLSNFNPSKHVRASRLKERAKKICNICAKVFNFKKSLQKHLETIHGENINE